MESGESLRRCWKKKSEEVEGGGYFEGFSTWSPAVRLDLEDSRLVGGRTDHPAMEVMFSEIDARLTHLGMLCQARRVATVRGEGDVAMQQRNKFFGFCRF